MPNPTLPVKLPRKYQSERDNVSIIALQQQMQRQKLQQQQTPERGGGDASSPLMAAAPKRPDVPSGGKVPLVQVLPVSTTAVELVAADLTAPGAFPDGLLAWGNVHSARIYVQHFDALVITAEEFWFNDDRFMTNAFHGSARCRDNVYWVPISEASDDDGRDLLLYKNHILQPVFRVLASARSQTLRTQKCTQGRGASMMPPHVIHALLQDRKRVLVVCMAGRNRSTSVLLLFLIMLPFMGHADKDTTVLSTARRQNWNLGRWHTYLSSKRVTQVYQMNRVQLESYERLLSAIPPQL